MNIRVPLAFLAAAAPFAVACGASTTSTSPDDIGATQSALDEANGRMTTADEAPAFGDPAVESIVAFDTTMADAQDMTTEAASAPGATSYHVALLWGHMPAPHDADETDTAPQVMSWAGSVSVDDGAIGVKKTLAFDSKDTIDPRTVANVVSFDSRTLPFVDGLFLRVVVAPGGSPALHFKTASLTTDVDLTTLRTTAGGVTRLADGLNGLAYIGYPDVDGCARGVAYGRWVKTRARLGVLRGRVIDDQGDGIGHVRGIWGHAVKADKDVFFGKYIAKDGATRGLFGGTYGDGEADGVWGTRAPKDDGALQLIYSDGYDKGDGRGVWVGRWSEKCAAQ
jgi:hypothetical protein